jgi:hypothetical protein
MALFIRELTEDVEYITEASDDGKKNMYISGIIMQSNIKNKNGRIYPSEILMRETNRYNENYVSKNRAFGELGHPAGPTINLDRVSHLFTELKAEGTDVIGKAKIVSTPMGDTVRGLIESGAQLGISSRGMGSVKQNKQGIMEVQDDFMLATAGDIVADPSAPSAFVKGILENVEWVFNVASNSWEQSSAFDQIYEETKKEKLTEAKMLHLFNRFINEVVKTKI